MISHKYKCIFVHIPKTGGASLEQLIWPDIDQRTEKDLWMGVHNGHNKYQSGGLQHLFASHIKKEVGSQTFNSFFKFTFVRNPWDKVISQFVYIKRRPDLMALLNINEQTYLKEYLQQCRNTAHVQWEEQVKFIFDQNDKLIVDQVFKFEIFEKEIVRLFSVLNTPELSMPKSLPHLNKSERKHYSYYYDDETKKLVEKMYARDISQFNYKFETLI